MSVEALALIRSKSEQRDGYSVVPFFMCREAAREHGLSFLEAEVLALENGICPSRYERNIGTIGLDGQAKLLRTKAAVAGCGGLGGWIVEMLVRMGFGCIAIADGDVFGDNNLNRQLLATEENLGAAKVDIAARRAAQVNAAITIQPEMRYLDAANVSDFIRGSGVVFDALDNNRARSLVFNACAAQKIPFVHGAIGGWFGQTAVFRAGDTPPWTHADAEEKGIEEQAGSPVFAPVAVAALQVAQAIKLVTGVSEAACCELVWLDIMDMRLQKIKL